MRYDSISITLPPGYVKSLDEESSRYGLNRSEFIRVLFDGYLRVRFNQSKQDSSLATDSTDLFPHMLPHRKEEAQLWLENYLKLVIKIAEGAGIEKEKNGQLTRESVRDVLARS